MQDTENNYKRESPEIILKDVGNLELLLRAMSCKEKLGLLMDKAFVQGEIGNLPQICTVMAMCREGL